MTFHSILFEQPEQRVGVDELEAPAFFGDLNLDQVIESVTASRQEYRLKPFFYALLRDIDAIAYRHEVFLDLENRDVWECIRSFANKMRLMREHLAQADKLYYRYQKDRWFLDAVGMYGEAVREFQDGLTSAALKSRGFLALREHLSDYVQSPEFTSLLAELAKLEDGLAGITYCLHDEGFPDV